MTPGTRTPGDTVVTGGWWAPGSSSKSCLAASSHCSTSCLPPFRTGSVPLCLAGTAAPWCKGAPPGIATRCPMAGSRDRLSPAALSPQHLCFLPLQLNCRSQRFIYLFVCLFIGKGDGFGLLKPPKGARVHLGAQGCRRGGLERRAQPPPCSCFALSCSQPALAGDVLPSLEKTAARQPHGPKTQPSFGSRRCEDSPAAAGVPPAVSTHGKRHQSQVSALRSPGSPRKPVKGASRDGVGEAGAGVGVTPVPCKPPQNGDISFLG